MNTLRASLEATAAGKAPDRRGHTITPQQYRESLRFAQACVQLASSAHQPGDAERVAAPSEILPPLV